MNQSSLSNASFTGAWALVLAAGAGARLAASAGGTPKQFLTYDGAPLYWRSALTMSRCACVRGLTFVFPSDSVAEETARLRRLDAERRLGLPWTVAAGGPSRQDSVRLGLAALPPVCDGPVLVHDAARPFVSTGLVVRLCQTLAEGRAPGVIPAIAVNDTIKVVEAGMVRQTLARDALRAVQTPQAFDCVVLRACHAQAAAEGWTVTDDASLLERCGHAVAVVEGETGNMKITMPEDLRMLEIPSAPPLPCVGLGYDVHRFGPGRPLRLGGVAMPGNFEVQAHSDGDVLLHALMDAILGCAGAGDIGRLFPDTDPTFQNADSAVLLDDVLRIAAEANLRLAHADVTIITQKPKIAPHRAAIQTSLASLLGLPPACVNVKATTEEGLGFTGAGQGIKAMAVVTALRAAPAAPPDMPCL